MSLVSYASLCPLMKSLTRLSLSSVFFATLVVSLSAQTYIWSGIGNGWQGQIAPTNTGTEDLYFANSLSRTIPFDTITNVNSLTFTNDNDYDLSASGPTTLTVHGGIFATSTDYNRVRFHSNITLNLPGTATTWDAGTNNVVVSGRVTGTGPLTLNVGSDLNGSGAFIYNSSTLLNNYTGSTTINSSGTGGAGTVAFWNSSPFSTGAVTITDGAFFSAHNTLTLANNFSVVSNSTNPWSIRNWDAPLTLTGTITLAANNDVLASRIAFTGLPTANNEGIDVLPGPLTRFPTIFTGNIVGGSNTLTVSGPGVTIFNFTADGSTYTGGTTVNNQGSLVFGSNASLPPTGLVNVYSTSGYAGSADVTPGHFATFLSKVALSSNGAIGVDTLPTLGTSTLADNINLTGFTTSATNGIKLGTATAAILTGTITPQVTNGGNTSNYHFGNGGGSLYVQSALANVPSFTSQVVLDDNNMVPLKLYLQGSNTYTGGTTSTGGFIIFDGLYSVPTTGSLIAYGSNTTVGASYIGYTESTTLTPAAFLAKFTAPASTWGLIGFDSHSVSSPVTISNPIDLHLFNDGVFIGTATQATITGQITPTGVTNSFNAPNTLRFTAGNGGTLTVNSPSSLTGSVSVLVGTPISTNSASFSDGTVILTGSNTYTGGTTVNPGGGITLGLGSASALGSGALTINAPSGGYVGSFGLQATSAGLTISNNIVFQTPDYVNTSATTMALTGSNNFTLAGQITSGPSSSNNTPAGISLYNANPINVTLSGDNSGYSGSIDVTNGTLFLAHNNAAGQGTVYLDSSSATVAFMAPATNPVLDGIKGAAGSLVLPNGTALTINTNNDYNNYEFGGVISGTGGAATSASLTVTQTAGTDTNLLYLYGNNTYTGGTTISGQAALGLGTSSSAGTGAITITSPQGGLVLNTGVTLTNALVFNSGGLGGLGTFAPTSVSGTGQTAGSITFGTNQKVLPGIPGNDQKVVGTLTLATNVIFGNGGTYEWVLRDASASDGYSQLQITGNLDLTSISAAGFILQLESVDGLGNDGFANLTVGQTYMLPILHTSGSIINFAANKFTFDVSNFEGGYLPASAFSVSIDGTNKTLYLNFTAVPEPSTYALMGLGLGVIALPILRRRRQG